MLVFAKHGAALGFAVNAQRVTCAEKIELTATLNDALIAGSNQGAGLYLPLRVGNLA